jgi:ParB family chromosome partitioning protein
MSTRKKALGKGLGALLGANPVPVSPEGASDAAGIPQPQGKQVLYLRTIEILPNPRQPRQSFSPESLEELANSIRNHGVLQPILVTYNKKKGEYVLLAGERRLRAAQMAGIDLIPALLTQATDEEMLELAIVENVQRDDLNPIDEARAYRALIDQFDWTQEQIAQRVGKNRVTVTNSLRLLKLGADTIKDIEEGRLTAGHARAILQLEDGFYRQKLRQEILTQGLSVREAERRAGNYQKAGSPTGTRPAKKKTPPAEVLDMVDLQDRLMAHLGCRVKIRSRDGKSGTVEIPFQNPDELDRFLEAIQFTMG